MAEEFTRFSRQNIRDYEPENWPLWRKRRLTRATRVAGPFEVETREGTVICTDGYIAIDQAGHPYPIAREEFDDTYDCVHAHPGFCPEVHSDFLVVCQRELGHLDRHRFVAGDGCRIDWA